MLASAEKLNAASPYIIVPITETSGLIVEPDTPDGVIAAFEKLGLTITRA